MSTAARRTISAAAPAQGPDHARRSAGGHRDWRWSRWCWSSTTCSTRAWARGAASFFTTDPNGNFFGDPGGIRSAILGTLEIVALATLIAVPIGIAVALYLTEYGKDGLVRQRRALLRRRDDRRAVDRVRPVHLHRARRLATPAAAAFAGWKGSLALSLLMLPIVIRSAEVVLLLVPASLREAALALGAPRWRVVWRVVLPTALPGLVTGSLLAVARGMGETAPLLFTVSLATFALTGNLNEPDERLPLQIYTDITSPRDVIVARAWGAALTLVALVLILNLIARADLAKEPHGMIPPETTSKESQEMSTAGGPVRAGRGSDPISRALGDRTRRATASRSGTCTPTTATQHAIKGIDIDFPANEVTAIIGPSGCGKSTMVRCINRMHEEIPGARARRAA